MLTVFVMVEGGMMPEKKNSKHVDLRPSRHEYDVESLIFRGGKPPKLTDQELSLLDFHSPSSARVAEALQNKPFPQVSYRELSRYVSHVAMWRMEDCETVQQISAGMTEYRENIKFCESTIRDWLGSSLRGLADGFAPIKYSGNVHVWFWSPEDADKLSSVSLTTGIPRNHLLLPFMAEVLSELGVLGQVAVDLKQEREVGLLFLGSYLTCVTFFVSEAKKRILNIYTDVDISKPEKITKNLDISADSGQFSSRDLSL